MNEIENGTGRCAAIYQDGLLSGYLLEGSGGKWVFSYVEHYNGFPVSLTLPVRDEPYAFDGFPAVFEGLLPEGPQLEALLRIHKIDRHDYFQQLVTVGGDLVGSLTVRQVDKISSPVEAGEG